MQINCDYLIMQSSINDILTVKTKSLQTFGRELHLYAYWLDIKYYQFIVKLEQFNKIKLNIFFYFSAAWRSMFECFSNISFREYKYLVLSNKLHKNLDYRLFSGIFENEQLITFKKI